MKWCLLPLLISLAVLLPILSVSQGGDPARKREPPQSLLDDPLHANGIPGIVFVGAPIFDMKTDGGEGVYQGSYHWRDGYLYPRSATYHRGERTMGPPRPGRNLYALVPARPRRRHQSRRALRTLGEGR